MINPKNFLRQCLLAVALFSSAVTAMAGPTFNVSLNTSALSGNGSVDFFLSQATTPVPLTVSVGNFSSNFGAFGATGDATIGADGNFTLSNQSADTFVLRSAVLGDPLTFDITFGGAFFDSMGGEGAVFSFGLNDANGLIDFATFDFDASVFPIAFTVTGFPGATITLAAVNAVPEPSSMLMMMTGIGMVGFVARRRKPLALSAATA